MVAQAPFWGAGRIFHCVLVFSVGWCLLVRPEQSPPASCTSSPGSRRFSDRPSAPQSQFDWRRGEVMRRFVYCKVVLTTSLVWVLVDVFLLLYFSECNKCDDKKDGSLLPALRGESTPPPPPLHFPMVLKRVCQLCIHFTWCYRKIVMKQCMACFVIVGHFD